MSDDTKKQQDFDQEGYKKGLEERIEEAHETGKKLGVGEEALGKSLGTVGGNTAGEPIETVTAESDQLNQQAGIEDDDL